MSDDWASWAVDPFQSELAVEVTDSDALLTQEQINTQPDDGAVSSDDEMFQRRNLRPQVDPDAPVTLSPCSTRARAEPQPRQRKTDPQWAVVTNGRGHAVCQRTPWSTSWTSTAGSTHQVGAIQLLEINGAQARVRPRCA